MGIDVEGYDAEEGKRMKWQRTPWLIMGQVMPARTIFSEGPLV